MKNTLTTIIFFIFALFLLSATAHSQDLSDENLCQQISEIKKQELTFKKRLILLKEALLMKTFPSAYSKPNYKAVEAQSQITLAETNIEDLENIIFTVGPSPISKGEYLNDKELQQKYNELEKELKKQNKSLKRIFKSRSERTCRRRIKRYNFSYEKYLELVEEKSKIYIPGQIKEERIVSKILNKTLKKLKLNWKTKNYTNIFDVHQYIKSHKVGNVIIVSHGRSNGHLLDSDFNNYPVSFFADISPTLYSLNFFSCYSNKTREVYELEKKMISTPSIYKKRLITSVKDREQEFNGQVAPLKGLKSFLKKVDKKLAKEQMENLAQSAPENTPKTCSIKVEGVEVLAGTLEFSLNRKFIGSLDNERQNSTFSFPCSFLKNSNVMVVKETNKKEKIEAYLQNISINYSFVASNQEVRHFNFSDGRYRSSILKFDSE